jgi:hypothetical protein
VKHTRIIVAHYGGPDALQIIEERCPETKSGEVRVKVLAAGVSLPDVLAREGVHPETPARALGERNDETLNSSLGAKQVFSPIILENHFEFRGKIHSFDSRQVISTFTGMSFLIGMVSKVGGSILKSVSLQGMVPVIFLSFPCTEIWKGTSL